MLLLFSILDYVKDLEKTVFLPGISDSTLFFIINSRYTINKNFIFVICSHIEVIALKFHNVKKRKPGPPKLTIFIKAETLYNLWFIILIKIQHVKDNGCYLNQGFLVVWFIQYIKKKWDFIQNDDKFN